MLFNPEIAIIALLLIFFATEIPALIFLAIYYIVRSKDKVKETAQSELEKMNIQDL